MQKKKNRKKQLTNQPPSNGPIADQYKKPEAFSLHYITQQNFIFIHWFYFSE